MFGPDGQRKYLNRSERRSFRKAVDRCDEADKRAFCLTLYYTGCRISEALELTGDRVDFSEQAIVFRTLKQQGKESFRIVPIPQVLIKLLDDLVMTKESFSSRLWTFSRPTGYRLVTRYMGSALVRGIKGSPKGLRHGFAVACISAGVPITTLQRWMGHSRLETTSIYLQMTGEEDRRQAEKIWDED